MKFTSKDDDGNKLEKRSVENYGNLVNLATESRCNDVLPCVYADLVMLAKSKKLNKSTMNMNKHYLELQMFLGELINYPEDQSYRVFKSESLLYGDYKEVNHHSHAKSQALHRYLFMLNELNEICNLTYAIVCTVMITTVYRSFYYNAHKRYNYVYNKDLNILLKL